MSDGPLTAVKRAFQIQQERMQAIASGSFDGAEHNISGINVRRERVHRSSALQARAINLGVSVDEVEAFIAFATLIGQQMLENSHMHGQALSVEEIADNIGLTMLEFGHILAQEQAKVPAT